MGPCPVVMTTNLPKGEKTMDLSKFQELWNDFLEFLDRSFQWLMYLFSGEGEKWPPQDYPNIKE